MGRGAARMWVDCSDAFMPANMGGCSVANVGTHGTMSGVGDPRRPWERHAEPGGLTRNRVTGGPADRGEDPPVRAERHRDHTTLEAQGFDAIETRVARSYERFVEEQGFAFRAGPGAIRLHGVVRIGWEAVSTATGDVVARRLL